MIADRMAAKTDRRDSMSYALRATDRGDPSTMLSNGEITVSFEILMAAGSEMTAATLLSGVTPTNS